MTNQIQTLSCPICNKALISHDSFLACPNHHGALFNGKQLLNRGQLTEPVNNVENINTAHTITCPSCSHQMQKVNFNNTGVYIDSCTNCPYRWFDDGELEKINTYKNVPTDGGKELLTLSDVDRRIDNPPQPLKEIDRIPDSIRSFATAYSLIASGGTQSGILALGLYGIFKSLLHSRFTRILLIVIVIAFIGIAAYMFYTAKQLS